MVFLQRWLLILTVLLAGAGSLSAASREDRAYAAALADTQDKMWSRAERDFDQFVKRYPKSTNSPMAVLMEAQAQFQQGKYDEAQNLLTDTNYLAWAQAAGIADQYARWHGEAQFAAGRFADAADTFRQAAKNYPQSSLVLTMVVSAAAAYERLSQWQQIDDLLGDTNGVFQQKIRLDPDSQPAVTGRLLLARAKATQTDYPTALTILDALNPHILTPDQEWNRAQQVYNIMMAQGNDDGALIATTNLMKVKDPVRLADGVAAHALLLEKKGRLDQAQAAWAQNLTFAAPLERQQQAMLKIAELAAAQNDFTTSSGSLENFLTQNPTSVLSELCLLTLGEMYLNDAVSYSSSVVATNRLAQAQAKFDQLLTLSANGPQSGKAFLDRGWCEWVAKRYAEGEADFREATQRMMPPADLAVATFKLGDVQFAQGDFAPARESYRRVLYSFTEEPDVMKSLEERALYQILRASLELKDQPAAQSALDTLLQKYSTGQDAAPSLLLTGEAFSDFSSPSSARQTLQQFQQEFPSSALKPDVQFAIARTYEREQDWPTAIAQYQTWLKNFPTNSLVPQVQYSLGRADFSANDEADAFGVFTNFVARYPMDSLAPLAQYWIADHYFRAGEWQGAETNYEAIFQTKAWQDSPLTYEARFMAGRAAMGRQGFLDATRYFTVLLEQTNCPLDIAVKARFAYGADLMLFDAGDTNNPQANLQTATNIFGQVIQMYPTNQFGARAWGQMGDCVRQLGDFDGATNAYVQVLASPASDIAMRSRAQIELGITLEKKAKLLAGDDQRAVQQLALDNYLDVFRRKNLRDGETADNFWVQKAGLQASALEETLGNWEQAVDIYTRLKTDLPQLGDLLDKKITAAGSHVFVKKS